jgi:hypothetical protein
VRSGTLASATRIYAFLVCTMMSTMPVHSVGITGEPPAAIRKYIPAGDTGFGAALELQSRIGRELLAATGIAEPMDLGAALSDYVANRLDELEDALGECASFFNAMNDRGVGCRRDSGIHSGSGTRRPVRPPPPHAPGIW